MDSLEALLRSDEILKNPEFDDKIKTNQNNHHIF